VRFAVAAAADIPTWDCKLRRGWCNGREKGSISLWSCGPIRSPKGSSSSRSTFGQQRCDPCRARVHGRASVRIRVFLINALWTKEPRNGGRTRTGTQMEDQRSLPTGVTPRLLSREAAATYCGITAETFEQHVRPHVPPIKIGARRLWDVRALDRWLDVQSGLTDALRPVNDWLTELGNDRTPSGR
jgi:hypothetical protein